MNRIVLVVALVVLLALLLGLGGTLAQEVDPPVPVSPQAAVGTAFAYQGRLVDNGLPADGAYDFQFELYDDLTGGSQVGITATQTITVTDGFFATTLDFGQVFGSQARYLAVAVRDAGSGDPYTDLAPRQALGPVPYALALPGLWTEQNTTGPNIVGGYGGNRVDDGAVAVTIGGGGREGYPNLVSDNEGTIAGGNNHQVGNANGNPTDATHATIGGGGSNAASAHGATVSGGSENVASGRWATVGGGAFNDATHEEATVAGGTENLAANAYAVVGGGWRNSASGQSSTVGGGDHNSASAGASTVGGGASNLASGGVATVSGGSGNTASGPEATVGGGQSNTAEAEAATVGGGQGNLAAGIATVGGGQYNTASGNYSVVGGGWANQAESEFAVIAGGGPTDLVDPWNTNNRVTDDYGTVSGGGDNLAGDANGDPTDRTYATVGGGKSNTASGWYATVGGGFSNTASGADSTVGGGGWGNQASGMQSTVSGGYDNRTTNLGATVGGGESNTATNQHATVGGGKNNTASNLYAVVAGGTNNVASGQASTVPGGINNEAGGQYSLAAGHGANANNRGCFVWNDADSPDLNCDTDNRWMARASGGVYFYTSTSMGTGVYVPAGGGAWSSLSDRNLKANVEPVAGREILKQLAAVPITAWNYTSQAPDIRHIGPMAQDFYAAFGVGEDPQHISTVDADGVALAAIQGLYQAVQEQQTQIQALEARLAQVEEHPQASAPLDRVILLPGLLVGGVAILAAAHGTGRRREDRP